MKIPDSAKYVVRDTGHGQITRGSRRQYAHAVKSGLGSGYYVWNRYTKKESHETHPD